MSRKSYPNKVSHPVEISDKTMKLLRDYCQQHGTQIRSEIDGLIQYAIEERLKVKL